MIISEIAHFMQCEQARLATCCSYLPTVLHALIVGGEGDTVLKFIISKYTFLQF